MHRFKVKHERSGIVGGTWGQQHTFRVVDMHRGLAVSRHISYHEAREACSRLNTAVEVQHTPGPWSVVEVDGARLMVERQIDKRLTMTIVGDCGTSRAPENNANANLIAAAPDLLAACEAALRNLDEMNRHPDTRDTLRAAIAKARGGAA